MEVSLKLFLKCHRPYRFLRIENLIIHLLYTDEGGGDMGGGDMGGDMGGGE